MTVKLVVTTNVDGDVFEMVLKNARYGVGRRHDNDLRIKETYISGYHAELVRDGEGDYLLADLGSSNGTFLNGRRIGGKEVIKAGDFIKFGILKVSVQELTDPTPKIVALKDRPAFARKEAPRTSAIAVERETGSVATIELARSANDTRATVLEPVATKTASAELARTFELKSRLEGQEKMVADLKCEIETRGSRNATLEAEIAKLRAADSAVDKALAKEVSENSTLSAELASRTRELAESKEAADALAAKLSQIEEQSGKTVGLLESRSGQLDRIAGELTSARQELQRSEKETRQAQATLAARLFEKEEAASALAAQRDALEASLNSKSIDLASKEELLTRLVKERDSLQDTISAKEGDLAASAGEIAKLAAMADSLSSMQDQLSESRVLVEAEKSQRVRLEEVIRENETEIASQNKGLGSLRSEIATLSASAEKDKGDLARDLEEARLRAEEAKAEIVKARAELEGDRKSLTASKKELERENAKLAKNLAGLEAKQSKQGEDLLAAKRSLKEKDAGIATLSQEAIKAATLTGQLETLEADLFSTRGALKEALAKESDATAAAKEKETHIQSLGSGLKEAEAKAALLDETLAERTAVAAASRAEVERISSEFEHFRQESLEATAAREAALAGEVADLRGQMEGRLAELVTVNLLLAETRNQADEVDAVRNTLFAERDELLSRDSLRSGDLQAAKAESNELRMELQNVRETSEDAMQELETSLRSRVAELETALSGERVRSTNASAEKRRLEETIATLESELGMLGEESAQLRVRHEEASRSNGRLQAELNREGVERSQTAEALDSSRVRINEFVTELESLKRSLEGKDREIAEREQHHSRSESETVQKLKRELSEAVFVRDAADEKVVKAIKEKQTLGGAFERLKEQLDQTEVSLKEAKGIEEELNHSKGLLARRVEKAEASNHELAARIKEETMAVLAGRALIEKLELQIREKESEAVQREREQVNALQADLSRASRRSAEDERRRHELEAELTRVVEARRQAEARVLALEASLLEQETETHSTRGLLNETEKSRVELASRLATESALVVTHVTAIVGLRQELAETIARFTESERGLMSSHGNEIDDLLGELRGERSRREGLEVELKNTREGLSAALHRAREESVKAQAKLLAEGNANLSAVEEELSAAIRSREIVEESRSHLEDELNHRDEEIEGLSQKIENLEICLRDEIEERHGVLRKLETTRAGFSESLRSGWNHLGITRSVLDSEKSVRRETESAFDLARVEIDKLENELTQSERKHVVEVRDWEDRYETLRGEKLTLASEDADLHKIREEILEATARKRSLEDEMESLGTGLKDFQTRQGELRTQREALLAEREELKASLNTARSELGILQKRCADSKDEENKQAETILAAERRIQSLRKLEAEMESAVERRRQQHLLNRGEVFSERVEAPLVNSDFSQEDFYRKLIAKLDLIDDLAKRYDNKWLYPKVSEQLGILKRGFIDFLQDHSVKQFDLEPGTVLSLAERKRIKLVPLPNGAAKKTNGNGNGSGPHSSRVVETLRPGYVYQNGSKDVIIRKAEVLVS